MDVRVVVGRDPDLGDPVVPCRSTGSGSYVQLRDPTGRVEGLAVHEPGPARRQVQHDRCDLLRSSGPAERSGEPELAEPVRELGGHRGVNQPRHNDVCRDRPVAVLLGDGPREAPQAALARRVCRLGRHPAIGQRPDEHDPAAASGQELLDRAPGQQERAGQVHREDPIERLGRRVDQQLVTVDAGVVDARRRSSERIERLVHEPLNVGLDRHVRPDRQHPVDVHRGPAAGRDPRAAGDGPVDDRPPDPARPSGHEDHLAREAHGRAPARRVRVVGLASRASNRARAAVG